MVMVFIKAANGNKFLRAPQLALHITVFRADPGLQSQSAIRPQLALSTKTIGGLNQSHQKRSPNRPYVGNLLQLTGDLVLATLGQQFAPHLLAQLLQDVQMFVEMFGSPAHSGVLDFSQPLVSMTLIADVSPRTRDRPAAIQRF